MLRVNLNSVSDENGVYYFRDEPFTGVGFSVDGCHVGSAMDVANGAPRGPYANEYLAGLGALPGIDSDCLEPEDEGEDEPLCYEGERFSGVAYDFDGDFCTGELHYVRGWLESQVGYFKSGKLALVELFEEGFSQKYEWYESGQIKTFQVCEKEGFDVSLAFTEDGRISVLSIDGAYFARVKALGDRLKFPLFVDRDFAGDVVGADSLYMSGDGVDSRLLKTLLANDGLGATSKLRVRGTALTAPDLEKLAEIGSIVELYVEADGIGPDDLRRIKSRRPDCLVELNRQEVSA